MAKETINHILTQDTFRAVLEDLKEQDIKDFVIVYRNDERIYHINWRGDALALVTLLCIAQDNIYSTIEEIADA